MNDAPERLNLSLPEDQIHNRFIVVLDEHARQELLDEIRKIVREEVLAALRGGK